MGSMTQTVWSLDIGREPLNKIIYLIYDEEPKKIEMVNESDSKKEKTWKDLKKLEKTF